MSSTPKVVRCQKFPALYRFLKHCNNILAGQSACCVIIVIGSEQPEKCVKMRAYVARAVRDLASHTHPRVAPECLHISAATRVLANARLIWNEAGRADSAVQDHFYDSTVEKVRVLLDGHFYQLYSICKWL